MHNFIDKSDNLAITAVNSRLPFIAHETSDFTKLIKIISTDSFTIYDPAINLKKYYPLGSLIVHNESVRFTMLFVLGKCTYLETNFP